MTIAEAREKCKALASKVPRDALLVAVLVLASSASFGLGVLTGREASASPIECSLGTPVSTTGEASPPSPKASAGEAGKYVASKNGTKYYLPSCSGASRISEANKVWFASAQAAQAAGYAPAANCSGL